MSDLLTRHADFKRRRDAAFKAQAQAQAQFEHKQALLEDLKAEAFEKYQCSTLQELKDKLAQEEASFSAQLEEGERLLAQVEQALNI